MLRITLGLLVASQSLIRRWLSLILMFLADVRKIWENYFLKCFYLFIFYFYFYFISGAAILRVPILYGEVEKVEESAVTVLWDCIQEGAESSTVDHCQQRFPTYTSDVARVCRNMADRCLQVKSVKHF